VQNFSVCSQDRTCSVTATHYLEHNQKRLWPILGNVWQFTRDLIKHSILGHDTKAHLVFGSSFATQKNGTLQPHDVVRPIISHNSASSALGFRLMRFKKHNKIKKTKVYTQKRMPWNKLQSDTSWQWDENHGTLIFVDDTLRFMVEHKTLFSPEIQHTLTILLKKFADCDDPVLCMKYTTDLAIVDEPLKDITPLGQFTKLEELDLRNTQLENITQLKQLTNLTDLYLNDNKIKNIIPLARLTRLEALSLYNNHLKYIEPLEQLTNLTELRLSNNQIEDITPLGALINLTLLRLSHNPIQDIKPLAKLKNLKELFLDNNQVQKLNPKAYLDPQVKIIIIAD
jgi:hypothetical protein